MRGVRGVVWGIRPTGDRTRASVQDCLTPPTTDGTPGPTRGWGRPPGQGGVKREDGPLLGPGQDLKPQGTTHWDYGLGVPYRDWNPDRRCAVDLLQTRQDLVKPSSSG